MADYLEAPADPGKINLKALLDTVADLTKETQKTIDDMRGKDAKGVNIAEMMELQMRMNKLSQATEMASTLAQALNNSIQSVASKLK